MEQNEPYQFPLLFFPLTEERYEKFIPKWCYYTTLEGHLNGIGLCWSLCINAETDVARPREHCIQCDLYTPFKRLKDKYQFDITGD